MRKAACLMRFFEEMNAFLKRAPTRKVMHKIRAYALKNTACARKSADARKHVRGSGFERALPAVAAPYPAGNAQPSGDRQARGAPGAANPDAPQ
ncbi:hypothetical protein [Burkholderia sp. AU6039]|uniref:hypothetical protein n=1 Tax=Burkholderia sp. AU6039 TaxID=2015344 RepID=UPI0011803250|nr:hypothetical protein [Burkholderia sp. AU6039]